MPSPPTIVVVPGAWHSPIHYSTLLGLLQKAGFPTVSAQLPSVGSQDPRSIDAATDAQYIREKMILPLLNRGKDVLLVMHSYSGLPGGAAAKGLSRIERGRRGEAGGIIGLVFMAALVAREGDSLVNMVGGKLDSWLLTDESKGTATIPEPIRPLYHDVPDSIAASAAASLAPHALNTFMTPSPSSAWADEAWSGRGYIMTLEDQAVPVAGQQMMVRNSGVDWDVKELKSGHCPFFSMPEVVRDLLVGWAQDWAEK